MSSSSAIDALLRRYDSGDYFARLINHPVPHRLRQAPELVYHATLNAAEPRFTIVMPTFNHESNVGDSLAAAVAAASLPFDCVVVDDGSEDGTVDRLTSFFESRRSSLVTRATIIRNPVPVYETACDNLGFTLAETEVVVEVQADIQIREPAFDALFLRAAAVSPTRSAISGRCGHTFRVAQVREPASIAVPPAVVARVGGALRQEDPEAGAHRADQRSCVPLRNRESRPVAVVQERPGTPRLSRRALLLPRQ